jgi:hypothetical protein
MASKKKKKLHTKKPLKPAPAAPAKVAPAGPAKVAAKPAPAAPKVAAKAKVVAKAAAAPPSRTTVKDVIVALSMTAASRVQARLAEIEPSLVVLRKAYRQAENSGRADMVGVLEEFARERGYLLDGIRGRSAPKPGEKRKYKVQQLQNGNPFLRLSTSAMGAKKGDVVVVIFGETETRILSPKAAVGTLGREVEAIEVVEDEELDEELEGEEAEEGAEDDPEVDGDGGAEDEEVDGEVEEEVVEEE